VPESQSVSQRVREFKTTNRSGRAADVSRDKTADIPVSNYDVGSDPDRCESTPTFHAGLLPAVSCCDAGSKPDRCESTPTFHAGHLPAVSCCDAGSKPDLPICQATGNGDASEELRIVH
jgi:hypothetical protein